MALTAPTFVSASTVTGLGGSGGLFTPQMPAGYAAGDVGILVLFYGGSTTRPTSNTDNGWSLIGQYESGPNSGTTNSGIQLWKKKFTASSGEVAPKVNAPGSVYGTILAYRGTDGAGPYGLHLYGTAGVTLDLPTNFSVPSTDQALLVSFSAWSTTSNDTVTISAHASELATPVRRLDSPGSFGQGIVAFDAVCATHPAGTTWSSAPMSLTGFASGDTEANAMFYLAPVPDHSNAAIAGTLQHLTPVVQVQVSDPLSISGTLKAMKAAANITAADDISISGLMLPMQTHASLVSRINVAADVSMQSMQTSATGDEFFTMATDVVMQGMQTSVATHLSNIVRFAPSFRAMVSMATMNEVQPIGLFIVETGAVVPYANSYVSVDYADYYLNANSFVADTWNALTLAQKKALLVWATRYIDQRATWKGYKTDPSSALRWPRKGVRDRDGEWIGNNQMPQALLDATCEMARYLISADRSDDRAQDGLTSLKVDVIELVFKDQYRLPEVPVGIGEILTGLGYIKSGQGGHAKIFRA